MNTQVVNRTENGMFSLANIHILSHVPLCDSITSSLCLKNVYQHCFWSNSIGQTYIAPIKKETHSFGLITPQCNGCVDHLRFLWNSLGTLAARPWRCQQGGVCQPVKGLSAVDPHGLCEHWTQIKGMEQRRGEEVNCYGEGGRCANSDLHPWRLREVRDRERETDRARYRISISHYLLAHDKPSAKGVMVYLNEKWSNWVVLVCWKPSAFFKCPNCYIKSMWDVLKIIKDGLSALYNHLLLSRVCMLQERKFTNEISFSVSQIAVTLNGEKLLLNFLSCFSSHFFKKICLNLCSDLQACTSLQSNFKYKLSYHQIFHNDQII